MIDLNGVRVPNDFNGVGLHDTPGNSSAAWGYDESLVHAQLLRAHGVTAYKILADGANKPERCRAYVAAGITCVVRPYIDKPWGRGLPVTPADQLRPYIDVGVQGVELGNEWNIDCEWVNGIGGQTAKTVAVEVANWWEKCLRRAGEVPGLIPLFPPNTPGGNIDHRACFLAIRAELDKRGLLGTVRHVAIHPRPHNNPPDTKWTPANTVTFDEWRWIRDNFAPAAYYWATEHGTALGDFQNHDYPRIDLPLWEAYNWEYQVRMNPTHPSAIEPGLAAHFQWYEAGWGHWGAWSTDAMRDSPSPEMPAPSPLWNRMEREAAALSFARYGGAPPPPPPPPPPTGRAVGIDVSYCQDGADFDTSGIDWTEAAAHNSFVFLRASIGEAMDRLLYSHYNRAVSPDMLVGFYHYLSVYYPARQQARFLHSLTNDLPHALPVALDVEAGALTKQIVMDFVARWHELTAEPLMIYTSRTAWNRIVGTGPQPWVAGCQLWVADAYNVDKPALPDPWQTWEFWQWGVKAGPEYKTAIDRNRFRADLATLKQVYGGGQPPPPPPGDWFTVTHRPGPRIVVGNYPRARVQLTLAAPWGWSTTAMSGDKVPDWGTPGGFELYAPDDFSLYTLSAEGKSGPVQMQPGQLSLCEWV